MHDGCQFAAFSHYRCHPRVQSDLSCDWWRQLQIPFLSPFANETNPYRKTCGRGRLKRGATIVDVAHHFQNQKIDAGVRQQFGLLGKMGPHFMQGGRAEPPSPAAIAEIEPAIQTVCGA